MLKKMHVVVLSLAMLLAIGSGVYGQAIEETDSVRFDLTIASHVTLETSNEPITVSSGDWKVEYDVDSEGELHPYLYFEDSFGTTGEPHLAILANHSTWTLSVSIGESTDFFDHGGSLSISFTGLTGNSTALNSVEFHRQTKDDSPFLLSGLSGATLKGLKKYSATYRLKAPFATIEGGSEYHFTLVYTLLAQ